MKMVGNDWENRLKGPNSSKSLPNCPKMSQVVPKCPKMPTSDASLSERTCFISLRSCVAQLISMNCNCNTIPEDRIIAFVAKHLKEAK